MTTDQNIGAWLNNEYGDKVKFKKVLDRVVFARRSDDDWPDRSHMCVTLAPTANVHEMYVRLDQLDYSADAKHGCYQA